VIEDNWPTLNSWSTIGVLSNLGNPETRKHRKFGI